MTVNKAEANFFKSFFEKSFTTNSKPLLKKTLPEVRSDVASILWLLKKPQPYHYQEDKILTRDQHPLTIRIFNADLPPDTPLILYFLGNGYIFEQFEINSLICARIAQYTKMKVALVQPRLAPEHPLPQPIYDYYDFTKTLLSGNYPHLKPKHTTLIGYCSGTSAACTVITLGNQKEFQIDHLILLNGIYDYRHDNRPYTEEESQDLSFGPEFMTFIANHQALTHDQKHNPLISPILTTDFNSYPTTTLLIAEHDRNRSSSEAMFEKLKSNGVKVKREELKGQTHNTIIFYDSIAEGLDPAKAIADLII